MEKVNSRPRCPKPEAARVAAYLRAPRPRAPKHPCTSMGRSPTRGHIRGGRTGPFTVGASGNSIPTAALCTPNVQAASGCGATGLNTTPYPLPQSRGPFPAPQHKAHRTQRESPQH